jgi:hypothetical protein
MRGRNLLSQTASVRAYDPLISFHDEPERHALLIIDRAVLARGPDDLTAVSLR